MAHIPSIQQLEREVGGAVGLVERQEEGVGEGDNAISTLGSVDTELVQF